MFKNLIALAHLFVVSSCAQVVQDLPAPTQQATDYKLIAKQVDDYYKMNELLKDRGGVTFAESIYSAVKESMKPREVPLGSYIREVFQVTGNEPVSLNEKLAPYSKEVGVHLGISLSDKASDLINKFASESDKEEVYTRLMMCLAYSESLSTADTKSSISMAQQNNAIKHGGVKHYYDARQSNPASQYNIGLFQFSPVKGGNIAPCLSDFKNTESSKAEIIALLGAKDQRWNARCGVHKILSLLYVQKNTSNKSRKMPSEGLTIHNRKAYNHYGPLQKSSGIEKLYTCYFDSKAM